jgi:hypothetical protein
LAQIDNTFGEIAGVVKDVAAYGTSPPLGGSSTYLSSRRAHAGERLPAFAADRREDASGEREGLSIQVVGVLDGQTA